LAEIVRWLLRKLAVCLQTAQVQGRFEGCWDNPPHRSERRGPTGRVGVVGCSPWRPSSHGSNYPWKAGATAIPSVWTPFRVGNMPIEGLVRSSRMEDDFLDDQTPRKLGDGGGQPPKIPRPR